MTCERQGNEVVETDETHHCIVEFRLADATVVPQNADAEGSELANADANGDPAASRLQRYCVPRITNQSRLKKITAIRYRQLKQPTTTSAANDPCAFNRWSVEERRSATIAAGGNAARAVP